MLEFAQPVSPDAKSVKMAKPVIPATRMNSIISSNRILPVSAWIGTSRAKKCVNPALNTV